MPDMVEKDLLVSGELPVHLGRFKHKNLRRSLAATW
jgi:hypothetical protein